jgi:hypothetical protein
MRRFLIAAALAIVVVGGVAFAASRLEPAAPPAVSNDAPTA